MDNSHFKNTEISSKTQVSCPWTSAAPLFTPWLSKTQSQLNKNGGNVRENIAASTSGTSEREVVADKKFSGSTHGHGSRDDCQSSASTAENPSTHFFNFLRLMKLFPGVHPATLHTVLVVNRNNFFLTVDKLLHAVRRKQQHINQKDVCNRYCTANNYPHHCNFSFQCTKRPHNDFVTVHDHNSVVCKCQYKNVKISDKTAEDLETERARKILRRCTSQSKISNSEEVSNSNPETDCDFTNVNPPLYKIPLRPLSPIINLEENTAMENFANNKA